MWGFAESQETVGISPRMFDEFVFPYQLSLLERFGLNCYGCCEPLDKRWDVVRKVPRLRRVSVSVWANVPRMAELLGGDYVFSWKPNPAELAAPSFDEDAIRSGLRTMMRQTKSCRVEVIMKDNHTLCGDPSRAIRWTQIAARKQRPFKLNRRGIMSQGANSPVGKPRLGVIPIGKRNHYLVEMRRFAQYYRDQLSNDPSLDLVMPQDVLFDETDIIACARQMEAEGADYIVFAVGSWVFSSHVISAVNEIHVPACLLGLSDQIANGSIGAALQMRYVLQEMGKLPFFLSGTVEDADNLRAIRQQLRAAWVKRTLRNRRIATIGGKTMMMYQTQVNEFDWKRVFGVDFPQYDAVHVFKEMEGADEAEARQVQQDFLARVDKVNWELDTGERIHEDAVLAQAKLYLGFRRLQQLYDIDVFANKCMPEMSHEGYGFGYAACLATCMLNDAGVTVACVRPTSPPRSRCISSGFCRGRPSSLLILPV